MTAKFRTKRRRVTARVAPGGRGGFEFQKRQGWNPVGCCVVLDRSARHSMLHGRTTSSLNVPSRTVDIMMRSMTRYVSTS
eukprot:1110836-Rhodomonas_salina.1